MENMQRLYEISSHATRYLAVLLQQQRMAKNTLFFRNTKRKPSWRKTESSQIKQKKTAKNVLAG